MKYAYHSLLPTFMQDILMAAGPTDESVNAAIKEVYQMMPQKFHNETTVASRKFYHEPRRIVPNAGFNISIPVGMSRK